MCEYKGGGGGGATIQKRRMALCLSLSLRTRRRGREARNALGASRSAEWEGKERGRYGRDSEVLKNETCGRGGGEDLRPTVERGNRREEGKGEGGEEEERRGQCQSTEADREEGIRGRLS